MFFCCIETKGIVGVQTNIPKDILYHQSETNNYTESNNLEILYLKCKFSFCNFISAKYVFHLN